MPETNVVPLDRTPDTVRVDNLIRRALKVRDPGDPAQVARALLERYSGEAQNLQFERQGLPFQRADGIAMVPVTRTSSYETDVRQANDDVELDLQELLRNTQLKDVTPELQGWARVIRTTSADGLDAARLSLDPRQRDRAFAARRLLGDYSRLSRYIGALSGPVNPQYRRLAQSIDILAGLILVLIGNALAEGSVSRGTLLLQVPASELIERRDAAINALRVLVGSTQQAFGPNEWPRGLVTYQRLTQRLDESGQSDLRVMLDESSLARVLDELIDLAAGNTPDGLRALGSTAEVSLNRLRRLVLLALDMMRHQPGTGVRLNPESPPLAAFVTALKLFAEGFQFGRAGARILFIARSPLVSYGLYGLGAPDAPTQSLLRLVQDRGRIAEIIDCFLGCRCDVDHVVAQVLLDTLLHSTDRAIDLYALGSRSLGSGEPEGRALAYGVLIDVFITQNEKRPEPWVPIVKGPIETLKGIRDELGWPTRFDSLEKPQRQEVAIFMQHELSMQLIAERGWEYLARPLAPSCLQKDVIDDGVTRKLIEDTIELIGKLPDIKAAQKLELDLKIPPHYETSLDSIANDVRADGT